MDKLFEELRVKLENADPFRTWWPFVAAVAVFLGTIIKAYMSGQNCPNTNMVTDLVILITGADGGKIHLQIGVCHLLFNTQFYRHWK